MTKPNPIAAQHCFQKLAETAAKMHKERTLTGHEIATAFLGVGVGMAVTEYGPVAAAEWLRDAADHIETGENRLPDSLN